MKKLLLSSMVLIAAAGNAAYAKSYESPWSKTKCAFAIGFLPTSKVVSKCYGWMNGDHYIPHGRKGGGNSLKNKYPAQKRWGVDVPKNSTYIYIPGSEVETAINTGKFNNQK